MNDPKSLKHINHRIEKIVSLVQGASSEYKVFQSRLHIKYANNILPLIILFYSKKKLNK